MEGSSASSSKGQPRALNMEQIHEIAMVVSDALQTYIEKQPSGQVGFLEMKIGMINALECLYQYQHKVMIVPKSDSREGLPCQ